jgi:DNA-binding NarL/FixJ family response regulator
MIPTVLVDDHPIVRQGLRALLEVEDGCEIIGEAADGLSAVELIVELRPAVAVVDVQLPDLNGLEVVRRVRDQAPETKIIVLSMYADEPYVLGALRHGAMAYVLKDSATTDLIEAVHTVVAGRRFLSAPLSERAIDAYAQRADDASRPLDRYEMLTSREREVLQLAAQGMSNAEIGDRLAISPRTAETHRANLLRKLGIQTQTELVRYVMSRGPVADTH